MTDLSAVNACTILLLSKPQLCPVTAQEVSGSRPTSFMQPEELEIFLNALDLKATFKAL